MSDLKRRFLEELIERDTDTIACDWILDRTPHIFDMDRISYLEWKLKLAKKLMVDSNTIVIVGSAGVGISLNPNKGFREYHAGSDIDVAVVSEIYFDVAWRQLRGLGSLVYGLAAVERTSVDEHIKYHIYHGTVATDHLLRLFPFGKRWKEAINDMRLVEPTKDRKIRIRLYRDFDSLRAYHVENLTAMKAELLERQGRQ